ncbi:hypothetical protein HGRIS_007808 [Hohenbuehelia grisea]|uniref:Endonuclease/exonuclease/phosphatase domain-containing protein n=1 Tax=Hohenbuehelia grisea TaxID=104357 RepID=A0ABR3J7D2_9AGAR
MATKRVYTPTPEQIALAEERRLKREKKPPSSDPQLEVASKAPIITRPWVHLQKSDVSHNGTSQRVKIMTWNLLAQCLVRRELFPTSDCLKAAQRESMLHSELLAPKADILLLQEVDRLEKLVPILEKSGYSHQYGAGPRKKHGCLIAYSAKFKQTDTRTIQYDEQEVRSDGTESARRGSSFKTKNIGLLVALQSTENPDKGVIVATTHLFWHPRYTYERARQAGILLREVVRFQSDIHRADWPCVIGGDFNFAPDDPAYSLLVGDLLLPSQQTALGQSRVVHISIDPAVPAAAKPPVDDDGEEGDPDRVITNARPAARDDGLLTDAELASLFSGASSPLRSAYDVGLSSATESVKNVPGFGERVCLPSSRRGRHEPEWTSYTHYWKTVLDYIFIRDPPQRRSVVTGVLKPHVTKDLEPGLPKKGVSASDHVSLCAEIEWVNETK